MRTRSSKDTHLKAQTPCWTLVIFHTVRCGDYWCKKDGIYAFALLKISNSPFCVIPFHWCLFVLVFVPFFLDSKQIYKFFSFFHFMLSNPIIKNNTGTWGKRRYGIFIPVFNLIPLNWAQWFSTSCKPCRRKIVKWLIWGKKLKMTRSETKRNSDHAWTYSLILTLTLPWICFIQNNDFKKDQILKK